MKSLICDIPLDSNWDLVAKIVVAAGNVKEMPGVFANVHCSLCPRFETCITAGGRSFEQFL